MQHTGIFIRTPYSQNFGHIVSQDGTEMEIEKPYPIVHGDSVSFDGDIMTIVKPYKGRICGLLNISGIDYGKTSRGKTYRKFVPYDNRYPTMKVPTKHMGKDMYVVVIFDKWSKNEPCASVDQYIGLVGNHVNDLECILYHYKLKWKKIHIEPSHYVDIYKDSRYICHGKAYTIDPKGCEDMDDALSIVKTDIVKVDIHIADPTAFISHNSELDKCLRQRGETLYLKHMQQDMIPEVLMKRFSLFKGECRSVTLSLLYDNDGTLLQRIVQRSVVIIADNLSYDEADKQRESNITLKNLYDFGKVLWKKYGYDIIRGPYDIHKMVEIYMITANNIVAELLNEKCPDVAIFRGQQKPTDIIPYDNTGNYDVDEFLFLRNMEAASYLCGTKKNIGHAFLKLDFYTHFTSPIRRYIDMLVHRLLFEEIEVNDMLMYHLNERHSVMSKASRDVELLDIIYDAKEINEKSTAYVIDIQDGVNMVYCEKYKVRHKCEQLKDKSEYYLGQLLDVHLIYAPKSFRIKEKFIIQEQES